MHLAALDDEGYPIATVRQETDAVKAAGFPLERVERPGTHYDENTDKNIQEVLLPHNGRRLDLALLVQVRGESAPPCAADRWTSAQR